MKLRIIARSTLAALAFAAVGSTMGSLEAYAASCVSLERQLSALGAQQGNPKKAATYAKAVTRQRKELMQTRRMASRAGCSRRSDASCRKLTTTIGQMEKRIVELEQVRKASLGSRGSASKRRAIKARMKRMSCGKKPVEVFASKKRSVATPSSRKVASLKSSTVRPDGTSLAAPSAQGTYRTVCVRICDGYFFPISNATTKASFRGDAAQCRAMCPRASTKLFVHSRQSEVDQMVDALGRRYSAMPYAFRHQRQDYRPSQACTCGRPQAPAPTEAKLRGYSETPTVAAPREDLDGETVRNQAVAFDWNAATRLARKDPDEGQEAREIRVVGPVFLPSK